jgi:hypothetical protein
MRQMMIESWSREDMGDTIQDTRYKIQDTRYNTRYKIQDTIQDTRPGQLPEGIA